MTGRELYEANRLWYSEDWGLDLPDWDDLTPMRQWSWEVTAWEYNQKMIDDEAENRMTDEGGPPPREDDNGN